MHIDEIPDPEIPLWEALRDISESVGTLAARMAGNSDLRYQLGANPGALIAYDMAVLSLSEAHARFRLLVTLTKPHQE